MKRIILLLALAGLFTACDYTPRTIAFSEKGFEKIAKTHIADKNLELFKSQLEQKEGKWVLTGETTDEEAYKAVLAFSDSLLGKGSYTNAYALLPAKALGDSSWGIVDVSVAPLRRENRHASEMVDQSIMGRVVRLLKKKGSWYLVQTHYGYIGWLSSSQFKRMAKRDVESWNEKPLLTVTALSGTVYSFPSLDSTPVYDVVLNATVAELERQKKWSRVLLASGKEGYIKNSIVKKRKKLRFTNREALLKTAKSMMGIPYLWGGNSSKGSDCSGYTQTVFNSHGIQLPRDAYQIASVGSKVEPKEDFSNILPGDLIFFGAKERVTHVAISLGGAEFIHQAGDVHINSFDENHPRFNAYRKRTIKGIQRVIK